MAEDLRSLLDALLQPNNDLRNAAEVAFREQLAAAPAPLARGLAELGLNGVPAAAGPDLGRQQLAVMLLGKVLVDKAGGSIGVGTGIGVGAVRWPALRGQQPEMQGALLTAMSSHPSPIIRKATCDVAGTFALSLHAELEDPSQTPWPELLAFALGAAGGLSDSVVARESAVRILANIVDVLAALEPQALVRTLEANLNYGLGGGGAGGADLGSICKIHELSVSAFTMLMEYLPDDVPHELFQPLLPLSLTAAAGLATLSALGAPAEGACDALENIAAVAVSSSVMFPPFVRQLVEIFGVIALNPDPNDPNPTLSLEPLTLLPLTTLGLGLGLSPGPGFGFSDDVRSLALEVILSLAQIEPDLLRPCDDYDPCEALVKVLFEMVMEVQDGNDWISAVEAQDTLTEEKVHFAAEAGLSVLGYAVGWQHTGPAVLTLALELLDPNRNASPKPNPKWKEVHTGLVGFSAVMPVLATNPDIELPRFIAPFIAFLQRILGVGDALPPDYAHPRVRYAALVAIQILSIEFAPAFQDRHHAVMVPLLLRQFTAGDGNVLSSQAGVSLGYFVESCPATVLETYADAVVGVSLEGLGLALNAGLGAAGLGLAVLEAAVRTVEAVANGLGAGFARFHGAALPALTAVVQAASLNPGLGDLCYAALEAATTLLEKALLSAQALGGGDAAAVRDQAGALVGAVLQSGAGNLDLSDGEARVRTRGSVARLADVLGPAFAAHAPPFLPTLLTDLAQHPAVDQATLERLETRGYDEEVDEDLLIIEEAGGRTLVLQDSVLRDISRVLFCLVSVGASCPPALRPYARDVLARVFTLLSANSNAGAAPNPGAFEGADAAANANPHPDVRYCALKLLPLLPPCVEDGSVLARQSLRFLASFLAAVNDLVDATIETLDAVRRLLAAAGASLGDAELEAVCRGQCFVFKQCLRRKALNAAALRAGGEDQDTAVALNAEEDQLLEVLGGSIWASLAVGAARGGGVLEQLRVAFGRGLGLGDASAFPEEKQRMAAFLEG